MLPREDQVKGIHHHQALVVWNVKGAYLRKRISQLWTVKWQQTQLSITEPKKQKQKQTKQITRTGTDLQTWRSHGGLSVGKGNGENGGKGTGNKKHKW